MTCATCVQGKFKKPIQAPDLVCGQEFVKPLPASIRTVVEVMLSVASRVFSNNSSVFVGKCCCHTADATMPLMLQSWQQAAKMALFRECMPWTEETMCLQLTEKVHSMRGMVEMYADRCSPAGPLLAGKRPHFYNPLLATCQLLNVSREGEEPELMSAQEDARLFEPSLVDTNGEWQPAPAW